MKRFLLLGILLLVACAPTPAEPSAEEVRVLVATSVAGTVSAHYTEVVENASPTPTMTDTPLPTFTPLPTLTPLPTQTPAMPAPVVPTYGCAVVAKIPYDNTPVHPNTPFDIRFSLQNTGTMPWAAGADLRYSGGTKMLAVNTSYELPEVQPGEIVGPYSFDGVSPLKPGVYVMTFKVQGGFCYPYVRIEVKR